MQFNEETFEKAMGIYAKLQQKGTFDKDEDPQLFRAHQNEEVSELLSRLESINKVRIGKFEDRLILVPEIDNEMHRYTNRELVEKFKFGTNSKLYTLQFIWMVILGKFYGDQYENTMEPRSFVPIDEVREYVGECIATFKKQKREKIDELTEEYELSITEIIDTWDSLGTIDEKTKSIARSRTRDYGFIMIGLRFWVEEGIIMLHEETEIVLTKKGRMIPELYYHQEDVIRKVEQVMESLEDKKVMEVL